MRKAEGVWRCLLCVDFVRNALANLNEDPYTNYCSNCGNLVDNMSLFV